MNASSPERSWARSRSTGGDRFSDLDLTFGIADQVPLVEVLDDWTRTFIDELDALQLVDLQRGPIAYRVFLLPEALQFDLSMMTAAQFRPAGPRFRLLFGESAAEASEAPSPVPGKLFIPTPSVAEDIFGWGVIYALYSRTCIERGRLWQAEHHVGAVRDHALSLACLRQGLPSTQARGYDDLPGETLARLEVPTSVRSNAGVSERLSPPASSRSCARARRKDSRTSRWSRSVSPSSANELWCRVGID